MVGRRRLLLGAACLLVPVVSRSAIVAVPAAGPAIRHRLDWSQLRALDGTTSLSVLSTTSLRSDFERLLGIRFAPFMAGLIDASPIVCERDAIVGEGVRPGTLGCEASLFVLGRDGAMFVALKGGRYGEDIETFGDVGVLDDREVGHRYLGFTDLDE